MLKLARRAKGHFMTLIEIRVHLIRCKPGHISRQQVWTLGIYASISAITRCYMYASDTHAALLQKQKLTDE